MINKQSGVSLSGTLIVIVLLIAGILGAMKVVPAYTQNASVRHILRAIAADPAMQAAPEKEIRASFNRRIATDFITAIKADDIVIDKSEAGVLELSANYVVTLPLIGNISLLLEFSPSSAK
jgi:Tfp pilus assembly protein PilV